jgi:hypothetical protein
MSLVHWRKNADAEGPDGAGYWHSTEGRFSMAPHFRHTVNPDSYTVTDYVGDYTDQTDARGRRLRVAVEFTCDTVRGCKAWAERRAQGSQQ